jgi:Xaa-Pro aminopeptidase
VSGARLERLRAALDGRLLVTNLLNVRYLTGLDSSNAAVLVDADGPTQVFTDFRYFESAQAIPDVEAVLTTRSLAVDLAERLKGRVQFEADHLTWTQVEQLRGDGLDLVPATGVVERLRAVKDDGELTLIRKAALAAERAFEALTAETWIGRSERELAWRLRQLMHAHGVDHLAFDPSVHAGESGSKPHGQPTDAIVETRMLVTVDWGARVDGYRSDCTRTVGTGAVSAQLREIYDLCLQAQRAAVDAIRPGMTGAEADAVARSLIAQAGYGAEFGHGLGHGVGLNIHETPRLGKESKDVLERGNVITVEPGIYLERVGGVRIEDLAVVTETGVELLTSFRKDLITVG